MFAPFPQYWSIRWHCVTGAYAVMLRMHSAWPCLCISGTLVCVVFQNGKTSCVQMWCTRTNDRMFLCKSHA